MPPNREAPVRPTTPKDLPQDVAACRTFALAALVKLDRAIRWKLLRAAMQRRWDVSVTKAVRDPLIAEGLVTADPHPDENDAIYLTITDAGRRAATAGKQSGS